jgi:hypothetical protein
VMKGSSPTEGQRQLGFRRVASKRASGSVHLQEQKQYGIKNDNQ